MAEGAERRAAEAILQKHLTMLKAYLRHLVDSPHDADDLAQDICVTLLQDPRILLQGADPGAYLRGIARHFASGHHRRVRRAPALEAVMEAAWNEEAPHDAEAERRALEDCLNGLPGTGRQLLSWRYGDGLTSRQIAERVQGTADAVRMALMRVRDALTKCLQSKLPMAGGEPS